MDYKPCAGSVPVRFDRLSVCGHVKEPMCVVGLWACNLGWSWSGVDGSLFGACLDWSLLGLERVCGLVLA